MSTYRMLEDHYVAGYFFSAGTTQSTVDVGGLLPTGWVPTLNVDPLDTAAVNAFHSIGPGNPGRIVQQYQPQSVAPPVTYWSPTFNPAGGLTKWTLTGLGATLSPVFT
jgi:hypothetical protein